MPYNSYLKKIDLLGSVGAGMLGAGIALYFAEWWHSFWMPILLMGAVAHGWAMLEKHRVEKQEQISVPKWANYAYWLCWALLAALFIYVGSR